MTLTNVDIAILRQIEAKPQVSSAGLPPECYELEHAGYTKTRTLNSQDWYIEITAAGKEALQRAAATIPHDQFSTSE